MQISLIGFLEFATLLMPSKNHKISPGSGSWHRFSGGSCFGWSTIANPSAPLYMPCSTLCSTGRIDQTCAQTDGASSSSMSAMTDSPVATYVRRIFRRVGILGTHFRDEAVDGVHDALLDGLVERHRHPAPQVRAATFVAAFELDAAGGDVAVHVVAVAGDPDLSAGGGEVALEAVRKIVHGLA